MAGIHIIDYTGKMEGDSMRRKLIIDGNAVYELDEDCMLRKRLDQMEHSKEEKQETRKDSTEEK